MVASSLSFCCLPDPAALLAAGPDELRGLAQARLLERDPPQPLHRVLALAQRDAPVTRRFALCLPVCPLPVEGVAGMRTHVPYAVVDRCTDWRDGHVALVMTVRNDDIAPADYLAHLKEHVALVRRLFEGQGLDGYYVYAGEEFEWAWLHWPTAGQASAAFATPEGQRGPRHSRSFQHVLCDARILVPAPSSTGTEGEPE